MGKEDLANVKGCGAAGGTTFGILNAFDTKIELGIKYLLELVKFKEMVNNYDLIITGDLGVYGKEILIDYMHTEYGLDISNNYDDAGTMLYDLSKQE